MFLLNMDQRTRLKHLEVKHIDQEFIIEKNKYNMKSVITFAFLILFQMAFSQIKLKVMIRLN